jgi:hypothetical protein
MSNGAKSALALTLGAGEGFLLWYLLREDEGAARSERLPSAPETSACSLKLDRTGLTANGEKIDVVSAVARCKQAGAARLALASDAPAAVYLELNEALRRAGVVVTLGSR